MKVTSDRTRSEHAQEEIRACPYCRGLFAPKRLQQVFCSDRCKLGYHKDIGTEGVVAGVTRLKRGVSVVTHFPDGPAAERAIALLKGQSVRVVPCK